VCEIHVKTEEEHDHAKSVKEDDQKIKEKGGDEPPVFCGFDLSPLILLMALSFHSFFEGLALGLVPNMGNLESLIIGISIHQFVASLSLGTQFSKKEGSNIKVATFILVGFAFVQSTGIAIGVAISNTPSIVGTVILSFAGGTLIYVAASEIIIEEFSKPEYKWTKIIMFSFGAAIIICLWYIS